MLDVFRSFDLRTKLKNLFAGIDIYDWLCIVLSGLFIIVGYIISVYAHENFLTSAMDMGLYNQYVYLFSHWKYPASTVYYGFPQGLFFLGDHATFLLPIESQFYWIFGKNVLLYIQILYMILGAIGLYKLIISEFEKKYLALTGVILYYLHYSLYNTLSFDFHEIVLPIALIPWLLYFIRQKKFKSYLIVLCVSLLAREDISIYLLLLSVFILFSGYENRYSYFMITSLLSGTYFLLVYKFILPAFNMSTDASIANWPFSHIGNSLGQIFLSIIDNPAHYLNIMTNTPEKQYKIKYLLYSGGFLLIFMHWRYWIILVPTLLITLLSDRWSMWGNFGHYNLIFSVWMPYVVISFINSIPFFYVRLLIGIFFIYEYFTLNTTNFLEPVKWTRIHKIFYSAYYYQRYNIDEIKHALRLIPDSARVSASMHILPHLAFREKIYYFPEVYDAEYIVIIENDCNDRYYYFANPAACYYEIKKYKENPQYFILYNKKDVLVLKKK